MKRMNPEVLMLRGLALEAGIVSEVEEAKAEITALIEKWESQGDKKKAAVWLALGEIGILQSDK